MADRGLAAQALAELPVAAQEHLDRLNRGTAMLADLSLADVLVMVPHGDDYVTIRHRRPVNARTLYNDDQVGVVSTSHERPLIHRARRSENIVDGGLWQDDHGRWIRTLAVPVRFDGEIIAVLAREFSPTIDTVPGTLQFVSFMTLRRFASMIQRGEYPYPVESRGHEHPPRVSDGLIMLDNRGAVSFASANARTNLTLLGVDRNPEGHRLRELGIVQHAVRTAYTERLPSTEEMGTDQRTMTVSVLPLLVEGGVTGALVLLRDITELRDRDRLLLTKDATIAEIHHRVKNNLQTVSSLLRLQSRRVASEEAAIVLRESVRRIQSIALVHELLSHRSGDEVPFRDIITSLVRNTRDAFVTRERPIEFSVDTAAGILPSDMSTTLAVVLSELLQNTIDHGFPEPGHDHRVQVRFSVDAVRAVLTVEDNGVPFPDGFDIATSDGLGLTIVRTLVTSELNGTMETHATEDGKAVTLSVPLLHHAPTGLRTDRAGR